MATTFSTKPALSGSRGLFPYSVAATLVAVGLPFASVILLNHVTAFQGVSPILLAVISISSAILASAVGNALWMQHPASNEVAFGELMLWSWVRSAQARRQMRRAFALLSDEDEVMSPHERLATLRQMSAALDSKDPYTYGHSRRVERLAYRTGLALELSSRQLQDLREAAAIHDVGKLFVPDRILLKEGALTDEEFGVIKEHPVKGAEMVAFLGRPELTETVRFHHERWDGKGYPDGIAGDDIPLLSRIVGTVDAYDAMTSMRSYRASLGHKRAVEILVEEKGKQFDAAIVEAFLSTLRNPVLAAISVPLLAGPIESLRRFLGWMARSARVDVATAAGAVGMTVAITGSLAGNLALPPRNAQATERPQVEVLGKQVAREDGARSSQGSAAVDDREAGHGKDGKNEKKRNSEKKNKKNKNENDARGNEDKPDGGGPPSSPGSATGSGGSSNAGTPAGGEVAGAVDAAIDAAKDNEFDPSAPVDPQPAKGSDCEGGGPDSVGGSIHCGG